MIGTSVTIGVILSFLYGEVTGLLTGGLVGPGYLALYMDQPIRIAITLVIAALTYLFVNAISNYVILFGRRRFMAMVLTGMFMGWLVGRVVSWIPSLGQDIRAIGYIIPGLIANDSSKQGLPKTLVSTLLVAGVVRLLLLLIY
ncbi:MAG TPA: poly-gamma-glutamate biosynthesis protein PgsC [Bacillota bacterium]|nr:poly-gamma-glutamate biosynthesis protein PgsC [Bacillota bacterium]HOH09797.1 poly-gamma-glutamate biosynthesis protein PgsC [Bacillota bacterium]HPI01888.1 poly-gamma-glutamate biosynthesis protein PgsC [Bacillota bacterium]HPM63807.1 poly-gamma-glutamate biosynthesis protein PgsC [Bacillota bacterium]